MRRGRGSPAGRGSLTKRGNLAGGEGSKMLLIDCLLCQKGKMGLPAHICNRLQPSVIPAPLSDTKTRHDRMREERGPTVGWPLARLTTRLSCTLLPHWGFPVLLQIFFFSTLWCHHGGPLENLMYANNFYIHDSQAKQRAWIPERESLIKNDLVWL